MTPHPTHLPPAESLADLRAMRAQLVPVLVSGARAAGVICAASIVAFAIADWHLHRELVARLAPISVGQLVGLALCQPALRRVNDWDRAVMLVLGIVGIVFWGGAAADCVSGQSYPTALAAIAAAVFTVGLCPWAAGAQAAMVTLCVSAGATALWWTRGSFAGLDHALVAIAVILAGSVYAAHAAEQGRLAIYRSQHALLAEEEHRRRLEQEQEVIELKARFVTMASHEFRTPLATILVATDSLDRYRDRLSAEDYAARLGRIRQQLQHMTRLLEDVLTIGKIRAGVVE